MPPLEVEVTTSSVPAKDRVAFWEEFNAATLFGLRCSTLGTSLDLDAARSTVDGLGLRRVTGSPHLIERTGARLATTASSAQSLYLSILNKGTGFFHWPTGTTLLREGQAVLYGTKDAHVFGFDSPLDLTILEIDEEVLTQEWGWGLPAGPAFLPAERVASLRGTVGALNRGAVVPRGTLAELTKATLRPETAGTAALYERARRLVGESLSDPELTPLSLADRLGLSARQLHRVFAANEKTPAQYIQSERLEQARLALAARPELSVTQAAAQWGFSGSAHFSRAFKRAFGHSPSERPEA